MSNHRRTEDLELSERALGIKQGTCYAWRDQILAYSTRLAGFVTAWSRAPGRQMRTEGLGLSDRPLRNNFRVI